MCEKTNNLGSDQVRHKPACTVTAGNFRFKKKRHCTIRGVKAKVLVSCAVTAQLICTFGFAYANCWFSYAAAQIHLFSLYPAANKSEPLGHGVHVYT